MANILDFALSMAYEAGDYTLEYYKKSPEEMGLVKKDDESPVTVADKGAERLMRDLIIQKYPEDSIVGEEEDNIVGTSGRTWYLDPIDGTKSFIYGVPLYSNLIALWDEQGPLLSIINLPALKEIMWAYRDKGCFYKERGCVKQAWVSSTPRLDAPAAFLTSGLEWTNPSAIQKAVDANCMVRTWGDGYGYYLVAKGSADIMMDTGVKVWDIAPMQLIITEAGGRLSGGEGKNADLIASNQHVHEQACALFGVPPVAKDEHFIQLHKTQ